MKSNLIKSLIVLTLLCVIVPAQSPTGAVGHFSKDGLSFDYPADWNISDGSDGQMQRLTLRRNNGSSIISIFVQREPLQTVEQLYVSHESVTMPYVESLARKLGLSKAPALDAAQCLSIVGHSAARFRVTGHLGKDQTTADVYTVALGQRLVHLTYVRTDKDEAQGAPAWKELLDSLKVEPPATPSPEAEQIERTVAIGMLVGKVAEKYAPDYPSYAKYMRVEGRVVVQITVDESGKVIKAGAVDGPQLLQPAAVDAVRKWKFRPTLLCNQPVKVTGTVSVNFTLM